MASGAVYTFLKEHNRPFSVNDIVQNVGNDHGKSAVQKSLDKLVESQKVLEKIYNKQKIYCILQNSNVDPAEVEGNMLKMQQEITELSINLQSVQDQLQVKQAEAKNLKTRMTTIEAQTERDSLKEEIASLKEKLGSLTENPNPVSDKEKAEITTAYEMYAKEYRKRKRLCMDMLNAILENYPKTKKHLFEDIGIETDEDVDFKLE